MIMICFRKCLLVFFISVCNGQSIGRVFIGQRGSTTRTSSFTFAVTNTSAIIPVYIDAFDVTNSSIVLPVTGNVAVTCDIIIKQSGYSAATFGTFTASNTNKDGTIVVSNLISGRQNSIQCYGQSQTGTQFTRDDSISTSVSFIINSIPYMTIYPSTITTYTTSFNVLLVLTAPINTGIVGIRCQADLIDSSALVNQALQNPPCFTSPAISNTTTTPAPTVATDNTTDNITTAATLAPAPTDAPVVPQWQILDPIVQLEPNRTQYFKVLKVVRNLNISSLTREYVVISCCSDNLGINISDTVLAVATLKPNITVNWDLATDSVSSNTERTIQNPAYSEVAPCACDLTQNLCDIGCCCDTDCTELSSLFTSCIPGVIGGQGVPTAEYSCDSNHFNKEDWFHLMCVEREYNSLLGYFYTTESALRNVDSLNEKVRGQEYYSYSEAEERTQAYNNIGRDGYRYGAAVQSVRMDANNVNARLIGIVALPQRVLSGECLSTAPIQYLKDVNNDCSFQLTENLCSVTSVFNPHFYVLRTNASNPAYTGPYGILDSPVNQKIAETNVNYYCTTDLSGYVKSTISTTSSPTGNFTFNYTLPTGSCADLCGNDICPSQDSTSQTSLPPRCSFDDGFTLPPEVSFNAGTNTCENAVVDVRYTIYWTGTEITKLDAVVILGNIALSSSPVVTQKYEAAFTHDFAGNTTTFDNYLNLNTPYTRSGSPGYDFEKSIWSGTPVYNSSTGEFIRININSARQMAVWNTGIDGLCYNAGRRTIMFGEDTFTSCDLRLSLYEFTNCDRLRSLIINRVNNLMAASYIGRYGYNDPFNANFWIEVQREDLTDICVGNYNETDEDVLTYAMAGVCTNMITGINLDIMYAETGQRNGNPIHEIIGAYISYPKSTWKLSCATGGACVSSTRYVESFPITSTIQFTKVPGNTPERLERWEENYDRSLCGQDICWEELLYPLSSSYTADSRNYVLVVTLVMIVIFMAFLLVTRPWW